jgi:hypothetical protein
VIRVVDIEEFSRPTNSAVTNTVHVLVLEADGKNRLRDQETEYTLMNMYDVK